MRIIVLSDTHKKNNIKNLPIHLIRSLETSDYILHLGDWQTLDLYHELKAFAPVDGVAGNIDNAEVCTHFGFEKVLKFNGVRFGLVHGHLGKGRTTEERALNTFSSKQVDVILFGHSHIPVLKQNNQVILFNPGSPTNKRRQPLFSYGVIDVSTTKTLHHVFFSDK